MAKQQRKIGTELDRFVMLCDVETGKRIRRLADQKNVSYSKFIAEFVMSGLDEIENEIEKQEETTQ